MTRDKTQLVRAVVEVIHGYTFPLKTWGPYFFPSNNETSAELQDRIFPIYFCCLRDMAKAGAEKLNQVIREAEEGGHHRLARNARAFSEQCGLPINALQVLSAEEQVIISLFRDRCVHGYLDGASRSPRSVPIVMNGKVTMKPFERDQILEILGGEECEVPLEVVRKLRWKFMSGSSYPWNELSGMFVDVGRLSEALSKDFITLFEPTSCSLAAAAQTTRPRTKIVHADPHQLARSSSRRVGGSAAMPRVHPPATSDGG